MEPKPISIIILTVITSSIIGGLMTSFITIPIAESNHTYYRIPILVAFYLASPIGLGSYLYSQYRAYKKFERGQQKSNEANSQ